MVSHTLAPGWKQPTTFLVSGFLLVTTSIDGLRCSLMACVSTDDNSVIALTLKTLYNLQVPRKLSLSEQGDVEDDQNW